MVYNEPLHNLQARTALGLMDALGIEKAHLVGNSQGGQSAMVLAAHDPHRVNKLVFGACHIRTGGDLYLMGNRPSEGSLVTREVRDNPTRENVRRYLRTHIDDNNLVTDDLVDYIHGNYTGNPDHIKADSESVSVPYDHGVDLPNHCRPQPDHLGPLRPDVRVRNRDRGPQQSRGLASCAAKQLRPLGSVRKARGIRLPRAEFPAGVGAVFL